MVAVSSSHAREGSTNHSRLEGLLLLLLLFFFFVCVCVCVCVCCLFVVVFFLGGGGGWMVGRRSERGAMERRLRDCYNNLDLKCSSGSLKGHR